MTTPGSGPAPQPSIELLWFEDCPNYLTARQMLVDLMTTIAPRAVIEPIEATDPSVAASWHFPGSPTIRVDGIDVDPSYVDPGDYTPRCRLYLPACPESLMWNGSGPPWNRRWPGVPWDERNGPGGLRGRRRTGKA